jgi:hypothetical protein
MTLQRPRACFYIAGGAANSSPVSRPQFVINCSKFINSGYCVGVIDQVTKYMDTGLPSAKAVNPDLLNLIASVQQDDRIYPTVEARVAALRTTMMTWSFPNSMTEQNYLVTWIKSASNFNLSPVQSCLA